MLTSLLVRLAQKRNICLNLWSGGVYWSCFLKYDCCFAASACEGVFSGFFADYTDNGWQAEPGYMAGRVAV